MTVENVVATVTVSDSLDLAQIRKTLKGLEEVKGSAPWLKYRMPATGINIAFYRSGKFGMVGLRSLEELQKAVKTALKLLQLSGMPYKSPCARDNERCSV